MKLLLVGLIKPLVDILLRPFLTLASQGQKRLKEGGGSSQGVGWGLLGL